MVPGNWTSSMKKLNVDYQIHPLELDSGINSSELPVVPFLHLISVRITGPKQFSESFKLQNAILSDALAS